MAMKLEVMRERIRSGKSVLYKNRLITSLDKLPTAAELASTDEEKAAAAGDIDAQIAALQQQKAGLTGGKKNSSSEANSEAGGGNDESDFPEDYPAKTKLENLGKTYAEVKGLNREQLIELDGIGEKTADEILAYGK